MIRFLALSFVLVILTSNSIAQKQALPKQLPEINPTQVERELFRLINQYRLQRGLPEVKYSPSLTFVARTHAEDQTATHVYKSRCNLHSWSANGRWSSCCYTPDHKKAACMWDKPRELTNYPGDGYEISFYSTYRYSSPEAFAKDILDGWKSSHGHNDVIINKNTWKNVKWMAMGVGVVGEYANVWFGKVDDPSDESATCEKR